MRWVRFLQDGQPAWGHLEGDVVRIHSGSPFQACRHETIERLPLDALDLLPPCTATKIVCVGRNYAEHARELGNAPPPEPLLFLKPPSALLAAGGAILLPPLSRQVEHEGELAVVMGKRCRALREDESPLPYIFGFTCLNDVTARDLQKKDSQWARAKGFDTFCPIGPWVETEPKPGPRPWDGLTVECRVNGQLRQSGNTADFLFSLERILAAVTAVMTLEAGDVIATGTPAGVGPLAPGDRVQVTIEGIGTLENVVSA